MKTIRYKGELYKRVDNHINAVDDIDQAIDEIESAEMSVTALTHSHSAYVSNSDVSSVKRDLTRAVETLKDMRHSIEQRHGE